MPETFPPNDIYQSTIIEELKGSGLDIQAVAFGDMFCNGIEAYRRSYIEPAGWECVFPPIGQNCQDLANEILERGIKTLVVTTDGQALAPAYCGRWYDRTFIDSLPSGVDPCGEDGEFHTFVTQTRSYKGKIELSLTTLDVIERFAHQRYQAKILPN